MAAGVTDAKPGFRLALAATCLALVVVGLGAFTRLVDAGLGCPDWPGCYGHLLWPTADHEIAMADARFPQAPVETEKTWPEMVHRYAAGTLALCIAGLALISWWRREDREYPFRLPMLLLFLVVWQALFGMWTVTLKLWPQVVTLHLLGGISTLALLWVLALRLRNAPWVVPAAPAGRLRRLKPWMILGVVTVFCQIALGGWTSSNYAALACADFPTCHGQWWPAPDFARGFDVAQEVGPNYLGGLLESEARTAIHVAHRLGALAVTLVLLGLAAALLAIDWTGARRLAVALSAALVLQIGLGVANVLLALPLPVAVAHNLGAALLLLVLVTLAARTWTLRESDGDPY
ncbi:MAG: COX15/CtaA family protein [Pseudomonadota bacterium]